MSRAMRRRVQPRMPLAQIGKQAVARTAARGISQEQSRDEA